MRTFLKEALSSAFIWRKTCVFFASVFRLFQKPFIGLPLVLWAYFVISYMALPYNSVWLGHFPDSDDYTYLVQTLDWLHGQSWFDNIQHRMSPPEGVAIHYSRFAQIPIAAVILMFRLFHYSWHGAALLTAFLLPVLYLGLFFYALRRVTERFTSPEWSRLSVFVALFASMLTFKFAPSQVDHHGLALILTITGLGLTTKIFDRPDEIRWPLLSAGVLALTTAIALETLPWMLLTSTVIGLWTLIEGKKAARSSAAFGTSLFVSGAVCLLLTRPLDHLFALDLLSYSFAYVALMGGIAASLLIAAFAGFLRRMEYRFAATVSIVVLFAALYLYFFPALVKGPYGAMDKKLAALFFANIEEALPLIGRLGLIKGVLTLFVPAFGLIVSLFQWRESKGSARWTWGLLTALLGGALGLALFYQVRVMMYAQLFSVIPLVAFAAWGWTRISLTFEGRSRFWAEIGLVLLIGPLFPVFLYAVIDGRPFNSGILLFPAQRASGVCDPRGVSKVLDAPPYNKKKLRIVNTISEGSELLFETPHEVMAAPYHTNVRGNLVALDFFSTTDSAHAEKLARENKIDLVVLCRFLPDMYLKGEGPHYLTYPDGTVHMLPNESFANQLASLSPPPWLKEIPTTSTNFSLYEVTLK